MSASTADARPGLLRPPHLWVTLGMCALIVLGAFEALAITTAMPLIVVDLHGEGAYALAFAAPLAAQVVGMVIAGDWTDRRGPRAPLIAAAVSLAAGLVIAGASSNMLVFIVGRLVQGLGSGAVTIPIYVLVARLYPPELRPRIFAVFAACWVVPSLVGPFIAGAVAQSVGWRWVFLGVIVFVAGALWAILAALRGRDTGETRTSTPWHPLRLVVSLVAAAAVLGLTLSAGLADPWRVVGAVASVVVALAAFRMLVPPGTIRAARGLPTVILVRGLFAAAFFGAETYIPYLLVDRHGFSVALAGLALTVSGVAWASGSYLQGRVGMSSVAIIGWGSAALTSGIAVVLVAVITAAPWPILFVGWVVAATGMGFGYPRLSVLTLEYSPVAEQGANTSALSVADALGAAVALALTAISSAAAGGLGAVGNGFAGAFTVPTLFGVAAVAVAARVSRPVRTV